MPSRNTPNDDVYWNLYAEYVFSVLFAYARHNAICRLMACKRGGIAQWFPDPVAIGQVGYMSNGQFKTGFGTNRPGHLNAPEDFERDQSEWNRSPFKRTRPPECLILGVNNAAETAWKASSPQNLEQPVQENETRVTIEVASTSPQGAVLVTEDGVRSIDSTSKHQMFDYFKKHARDWIESFRKQGVDVVLHDLVFVTGYDTTRRFAAVAWKHNSATQPLHFALHANRLGPHYRLDPDRDAKRWMCWSVYIRARIPHA